MKQILIILVATISLATTVNAQDTTIHAWTLEECLQYAKVHNIQLKSLQLSANSAHEDLLQAKASRLPNVNATITQNLVNSNNTNPVVGGFQTQASLSGNYGVSSSMTLYNGGYINNDIRSKELGEKSASLNISEASNDITLSITQAYLDILMAKENILYLEEVLKTSQLQLNQGNNRFDAGSISKKELLQLQAQEASDRYNLTNAQNTLRSNLLTLRNTLQLPSGYVLDIIVPENLDVFDDAPALEDAITKAQITRPEVASSFLAIEQSNLEINKLKASTLPSLSLGAGIASGYSNNQDYKYFNQLNNNFYQSLGLTLSVPIYSRRTAKTNINKAKIAADQSRLELKNVQLALNQSVEQAFINMQNAQARFTSAEEQFKANEAALDITNQQLELGSVNIVELQQQKNTFVQVLQNYTQAKYAAILYQKIYTFYTGVPVKL